MNNGLETRYFLSALTGAGYYALHRQFLRPPERYFCILKGGPGCGKSTFLKRVGDAGRAAGLAVVRLHCAGDPPRSTGSISRKNAPASSMARHRTPSTPRSSVRAANIWISARSAARRRSTRRASAP